MCSTHENRAHRGERGRITRPVAVAEKGRTAAREQSKATNSNTHKAQTPGTQRQQQQQFDRHEHLKRLNVENDLEWLVAREVKLTMEGNGREIDVPAGSWKAAAARNSKTKRGECKKGAKAAGE